MNSNLELLKAIHNHSGILNDISLAEISQKISYLRDISANCDDEDIILKAQAYLRMKFLPLIRSLINGTADEETCKNIYLNLKDFQFKNTKVTFTNSLPLLAQVCVLISSRESWKTVGKDSILLWTKIQEAEDCVKKFEASIAPKDIYYYIVRGIMAGCYGDLELSHKEFSNGVKSFYKANLIPSNHLIPDFRGAFNTVSSDQIYSKCVDPAEDLPLSIEKTAESGADYLLFSAVDIRYFRRFVKHTSESFFENCSSGSYHIHLVAESSEEAEAAFNTLGDIRKHPNLGLSYSKDLGGEGNNAYYTMVRYFYLEKIRKIYDMPIFVSDVDLIFKKDLANFHNEFKERGYHVGVYSKPRLARCIPWFALSATLLYISNDDIGRLFSTYITRLSQKNFSESNDVKYNMDQNIIYSLMQFFQIRMPSFMRCNLFALFPSPYIGLDKRLYPDPLERFSA